MRGIVDSMADYLGRDTEELGLRVGLHSGATTAGVLRGERARFQLFGDTVNTGRSRFSLIFNTLPSRHQRFLTTCHFSPS